MNQDSHSRQAIPSQASLLLLSISFTPRLVGSLMHHSSRGARWLRALRAACRDLSNTRAPPHLWYRDARLCNSRLHLPAPRSSRPSHPPAFSPTVRSPTMPTLPPHVPTEHLLALLSSIDIETVLLIIRCVTIIGQTVCRVHCAKTCSPRSSERTTRSRRLRPRRFRAHRRVRSRRTQTSAAQSRS